MKNKRIGILLFNKTIYESGEYLELLNFIKFIPIRIELLAYKNQYEAYGISKAFDELNEGSMIPVYKFEEEFKDGVLVSIKTEKIWQ